MKFEGEPKTEIRKVRGNALKDSISDFGFRSSFRFRISIFGIVLTLIICLTSVTLAEQFGDIFVSQQSLHSGETSHGYTELRILLENRSPKAAHEITLVYPDQPWIQGNCIRRLSRTIALPPGTRSMVSLSLLPLPAPGNNQLRIETDGERAGEISISSRGRTAGRRSGYSSSASAQTAILVSRNVNLSDFESKFESSREFFSARMATGPADFNGYSEENCWKPGATGTNSHWIELTYEMSSPADRVRIHAANGVASGEMVLTGVSGTNLATLPFTLTPSYTISPGHRGRYRPPTVAPAEYTFPTTLEPVKTVRLNFSNTAPSDISIDAMEVIGPTETVWASDATASSESPPPASRPGRTPTGLRECLRADFPVSEWSDQWLAYTAFDAIALADSDLTGIPPGVADALWRYVECGGNLFVFGQAQTPDAWKTSGGTDIGNGKRFGVGFGHYFALDERNASALGTASLKSMTAAADNVSRWWDGLPLDEGANASFSVVENLRVPIRGMVFLMLGFVIVIGPANIIVLTRRKRRTWLLWTIPAISFLTCLIVLAYSLLSEGVTPDCRIESVTFLDQGGKRAATIGAQAFYCPLTPSGGLKFGYDTEVTPLVTDWQYGSAGTPRDVDWTQSQHLRRGWVTARVPAHFVVRKTESRRERLQLERDGENVSVVNGLGAPIQSLWLCDAKGRIFSANNVAAGAKAGLTLSPQSPSAASKLSEVYSRPGYGGHLSLMTNNPTSWLRPGTYMAQMEQNPFLENGLGPSSKHARVRSAAVVFGTLE